MDITDLPLPRDMAAEEREAEAAFAAASCSAAPGWSYSHYRASLYLDGERFAIVTSDGRSALSKKDAVLLLEALNRKPQNDKLRSAEQ